MFVLASVPAGHPYVDAIVDPELVAVLADPTPPGATLPGQWWPPQWLDPEYVRDHVGELDVLHVHFGFDSMAPAVLDEVVDLLARHDVPLILTVHDLHNPHFGDPTLHAARLEVLVEAAAAVVTLTDGAAAEIARRWGREALVLPHPHVLPIDDVGSGRTVREVPVVALHAKGLRANIDPWPVLDELLADPNRTWDLRLDVDEEALASPRADEVDRGRLAAYRAAGVDVRVHPRFTDDEMVDYLGEIDVMVLPYRFGTHSGWVEACHDAGVQAVVPDCGHFHRQHAGLVFGYGLGRFDAASLRRSVAAAQRWAREATTAPDDRLRRERMAERQSIRRQTGSLYRRVLAGRAAA
ncbi:glycosyltransferase [Mycolicibacterium sediminis]|uniref:glycosyltransferase n=1 Tax=Mycolicibacterium sediminis TaxID=1286180 RepID=UPI0013D15E1F|nr:glycosyltransferase [Mycolicibacterium sediminis]